MLQRRLAPGPAVPRLRFRAPNVHVPLWLLALGWLGTLVLRVLLWAATHPRSAAAGLLALWLVLHPPPAWQPLAIAAVVALGVWWARWPRSFRRHVSARAQAAWRRLWVYRRDWQPAMVTSGLSLTPGLGGALPTLKRVSVDADWDLVRVRMLPGQTIEQWQQAAPRLAQTWGLRIVRVRRTSDPQVLTLVGRRQAARGNYLAPAASTLEQPATRQGAFPRHPG
jgi:S-DNA-T family DNA segregation ATPase FtsK/SpoIIIE